MALKRDYTVSQTEPDKTLYFGKFFEVFIDADYEPPAGGGAAPDCASLYCIYLPIIIAPPPLPGQVWTMYYYAGGSRAAMQVIDHAGGTSGVYYLYTDHLGSTSVTADETGLSTSALMYKAWGETRAGTGDAHTDYGYTGQREDQSINLMWYGSRWYDPYLSRWTSPDSIIPEQVQGVQAWDRYAYVNNNPIRYNDPSGHFIIGPLVLITAGVLLIGAAFSISEIITGIDQVAWASSQPEVIASEQEAAQLWQDNCMGQCHYADAVDPTAGYTIGGPRPGTPVSDTLGEGYYNIVEGTVGIVGSATGLYKLGTVLPKNQPRNLDSLADDIGEWVSQGDEVVLIKKENGDIILRNETNTRKFRADLTDTYPHQNPHTHFEWIDHQNKWVKSGPIFPFDVEPK